jgi:hypothetical protein
MLNDTIVIQLDAQTHFTQASYIFVIKRHALCLSQSYTERTKIPRMPASPQCIRMQFVNICTRVADTPVPIEMRLRVPSPIRLTAHKLQTDMDRELKDECSSTKRRQLLD